MHLRHHVDAVDHERRATRHAQRDVQDRTVLGHVDVVAAEHRVDALAEARLDREVEQQPEGLVGDAVLRVVEVQPGGLGREAGAPVGVVGEELAQVAGGQPGVVQREGVPGRGLRRGSGGVAHGVASSSIRSVQPPMSPTSPDASPGPHVPWS